MPTKTASGVWVEYTRSAPGPQDDLRPEVILRPHKSKIAALESAVENMNGAIEVPFGSTLAEALEAERQRKVGIQHRPGPSLSTQNARDIVAGKPRES